MYVCRSTKFFCDFEQDLLVCYVQVYMNVRMYTRMYVYRNTIL
jgi:hypothetical protein